MKDRIAKLGKLHNSSNFSIFSIFLQRSTNAGAQVRPATPRAQMWPSRLTPPTGRRARPSAGERTD